MDELAAAAGKDPVAFGLALLDKNERAAGVLELAADMAGWERPARAGSARGIAVHESFGSFVAQVADVSMTDGKVKVERVVCAVDCRIAVDPDVIRAQMEGCIGFALGAMHHSEIEIKGGRAAQRNFDTYRSLRIHEMPTIEVHIVASTAAPTGVGEPGVPPPAPAVANAVAKLGRPRVRRLPLTRSGLVTTSGTQAARPGGSADTGNAGLRHIAKSHTFADLAMNRPPSASVFPGQLAWENAGTSRIPFMSYTSDALHKLELERFFYRDHWCYVGLEAEIPSPGDFKRTVVGERSVILVRDMDGQVNVVENVCAHRGMSFCRERHGNRKDFTCPYHQWNYSLKGDLQGVPFRRGVKQGGVVQGGMPADFKPADNGLTKLKAAVRGGVVFASFDHDVEPLEDFLGAKVLAYFDRLFDGRALKLLGYNRQRIPGNWKLMQENIKDPYHPGLLHTWFVTFGLWRADNKSQLVMDDHHRHAAMISTRGQTGQADEVTQVASFKADMKLEDPRFLDIVAEPWWGGPTAVMTTVFPSVIFQQQVNSVSTRHIQPDGHGAFDFVWTHFGFADDSDEMIQRRLRQANLFGPAGFVSADDGEVIELSQQGFEQKPFHRTLAELGGTGVGDTDHMVTETLIRGMYEYWRKVMEA